MEHLTGCTALAAACNTKALCHSQNVWGNEMNSLLASSSLRYEGTLSYQHRWSLVLERSLVRTANNQSPRHRPSLTNDSLGSCKNVRVPGVLCNQMCCEDVDRQCGSRGLATTSLRDNGKRHAPRSCTRSSAFTAY